MNTQYLEAFQILEKASDTLNRRITLELLQWDLSVVQFQTLEFIASRTASTPSHCSHALNISTSGITRVLDQLERRSLLMREKVGHDRRLMYLRLTHGGLNMLRQASEVLNDRCKDVATRFPLVELASLNNALKKLSLAMQLPPREPDLQRATAPRPLVPRRVG